MPRLERQTPMSLEIQKFVRRGEKVIFDSPEKQHKRIATDHFGTRVVDDGGFIFPTGERFLISGLSTTCDLRGDPKEARQETARIITEITGKKVKIVS